MRHFYLAIPHQSQHDIKFCSMRDLWRTVLRFLLNSELIRFIWQAQRWVLPKLFNQAFGPSKSKSITSQSIARLIFEFYLNPALFHRIIYFFSQRTNHKHCIFAQFEDFKTYFAAYLTHRKVNYA